MPNLKTVLPTTEIVVEETKNRIFGQFCIGTISEHIQTNDFLLKQRNKRAVIKVRPKANSRGGI
jgi:hypothetical protein